MGVINVTPDSFSDGGLALDAGLALARAQELEAGGADLLDIGAESTRPGAEPVTAAEEWARLGPVLRHIHGRVKVPVSVDTYKAETAMRAIEAGAAIVNDISGLRYDPALAPQVASTGAALILMHTRGHPQEMYNAAHYHDVVGETISELQWSVNRALEAGIALDRLIVDPGVGFAKQASHSLAVLAGLDRVAGLGRPLLVGVSRKSFLIAATGALEPQARDWPTAAAVTAAVLAGAHILRVHNVENLVHVVRVADAIRAAAGLR